uniref:CRC domain-containing protein n=1 Tax=Panagrolaimus sp. JU765 TaxID=591449 RepID=A0AC34QCS2_9BILA
MAEKITSASKAEMAEDLKDMPKLPREDRRTPMLVAIPAPRKMLHPNITGMTPRIPVPPNPTRPLSIVAKTGINTALPMNVSESLGWKKKNKSRRLVIGRRKPCNCTRSQCLKLYCDCFANGEFCLDCNCKDCHNNLEHNHDRSKAIKQSLEKNPHAFKPKIGVSNKGKNADMERLHQKGCHCKKSNCLKNYCECFEAKVACTERCKCVVCRNTETDRQVRFSDRFTAVTEFDRGSPYSDEEIIEKLTNKDKRTKSWYYLTDDVIQATTSCLFAQASESENKNETQEEAIKNVFAEFGRCMNQIFDATRMAEKSVAIAAKQEFPSLTDEELEESDREYDVDSDF